MLIQHAIFGFAALCCGPVAFYGRPYVVMERSLYFAAVVSSSSSSFCSSLEHRSKFQPVSRLGFVTAPTSLNGGQANFARCLAVSWAGTLHFRGSCPLTEFCQVQNSLSSKSCILLYWQRYCTAFAQQRSTEGASNIQAAAITLGIGAHSRLYFGSMRGLHLH